MVFQVAANFYFTAILTIMYANIKYNKVVMFLCIFYSSVCGNRGVAGDFFVENK